MNGEAEGSSKLCSGVAVPPLRRGLAAGGRSCRRHDLHPPSSLRERRRSQGCGCGSSQSPPQRFQLSPKVDRGWFPLNVPSRAAAPNNAGEPARGEPGKRELWRVGLHKQQGWVNTSGLALGFPLRNLPLRLRWVFLDSTCLFLGGIINAEGNKEKKIIKL